MGSYLAFILLLFCLSAAGGSTHEHNAEGSAGASNVETSKPDVKAEGNTSNVNTEGNIPVVGVEDDTPEVHGERHTPEETVGKNIPEVNINKNTPEVSVEGGTPEVGVKTTSEENTGKDTDDTTTEESDPEIGVEGIIPEVTREENDPEVSTAEGKLRGTILRTHKGKVIYAFLGIPYASPPTGKLRFMVGHAQIIHMVQFRFIYTMICNHTTCVSWHEICFTGGHFHSNFCLYPFSSSSSCYQSLDSSGLLNHGSPHTVCFQFIICGFPNSSAALLCYVTSFPTEPPNHWLLKPIH